VRIRNDTDPHFNKRSWRWALKQTRQLKIHPTIKPVTNDFLKFDEQKNEIRVFLGALDTLLENRWECSKVHRSRVSLLCNANSVFCPKHSKQPSLPYMRPGIELKSSMGVA
jgi:hypothetical protein